MTTDFLGTNVQANKLQQKSDATRQLSGAPQQIKLPHSARVPGGSNWLAAALLLSLGLIWGSGYSIAHYATVHAVPPLGYAFWQSLGPACALLLLMAVLRQPLLLSAAALRLYVLSGLIGIAVPNSAMYFAAAHLPAGLLAVVVNTVPLFTFCLALLLREERFCLRRALGRGLGVLCCLIGLAILVLPGVSWHNLNLSHWLLIALIAPICFALCAVLISRYLPPDCTALSLSCGMLWAASLWLLPVVWWQHAFYALHTPWHGRDYAIILEIILSSIGYVIFCKLLQMAGSVYYSLVGGVVAIVGLLWGLLLFKEHLQTGQWFAVACIVFSIFLLSYIRRSQS